jgi:predicted chitinase
MSLLGVMAFVMGPYWYFSSRFMKKLDEKVDKDVVTEKINGLKNSVDAIEKDLENKADKSLVESMDKKLDLILTRLSNK